MLKDRRGATSVAVAALLSVVVILILMRVASSPKGAEVVFWTKFGFVKWVAELLKVAEYLKDFEEYLKYLQGTELWPLTVSILSFVCMYSPL